MGMSPTLMRPRNAFTPKSIAGLQLWLDASDSSTITTSTGVSEWRDKSATGSKWAQTTANNQPTTGTQTLNGRNVIVFDGVNDGLSAVTPLVTAMPLSFFVVQRIVAKTSFGMTYSTSTSSDFFNVRQNSSTGGLNIVAGSPSGSVINLSDDRTGITDVLSWVVPSSGNSVLRRNGTQLTLSDATLKPVLTGTHYLGQRNDGFYLNGMIAEVIAYKTQLSDAQRKSVESYLALRWGVTLA